MLDDLAGKRTGERIQILRERTGLSRPVLAGLVGMSASWLKGIEQGRRLPPRLPVLVKLAEALAVGDVAVLAGTDMDLGGATSVPVASFARIPHDAVPAIRDAVRDPMLSAPDSPVDVESLASRTADAWRLWHTSREHRTEVGRILPRLVTDARAAARSAEGADRRAAQAVLAEVYALVQHEIVWASEAELTPHHRLGSRHADRHGPPVRPQSGWRAAPAVRRPGLMPRARRPAAAPRPALAQHGAGRWQWWRRRGWLRAAAGPGLGAGSARRTRRRPSRAAG